MVRRGTPGAALAFACLSLIAAGCGGDDEPVAKRASPPPHQQPLPAPPARPALPRDTAVIRAWADTLRAGRIEDAASYFTVPALAANGSPAILLRTHADVELFNRSLPCGAKLLSTRRLGRFTVATFRLTERAGGGCGAGTGLKAATAFRLSGGKITEWRRVAVPKSPPPEPKPSPEV